MLWSPLADRSDDTAGNPFTQESVLSAKVNFPSGVQYPAIYGEIFNTKKLTVNTPTFRLGISEFFII